MAEPEVTGENSGRVAVVLVNWNGAKDTIECLDSLVHAHAERYAVILVDNGSTDDSVERIEAWHFTASEMLRKARAVHEG